MLKRMNVHLLLLPFGAWYWPRPSPYPGLGPAWLEVGLPDLSGRLRPGTGTARPAAPCGCL